MDKFNFLIDSSFNLLKASEKNEKNLKTAIQKLNVTSENIESRISDAVTKSSNDTAQYITKKVLSDLKHTNETAKLTASRLEKAAKFSIFKIGGMFFLFFLMAGALLWFLFIKEIPTIGEFQRLRNEKAEYIRDINKLKEYGNISNCDGKPCIQVNPSSKYGNEEMPYYIIVPKK